FIRRGKAIMSLSGSVCGGSGSSSGISGGGRTGLGRGENSAPFCDSNSNSDDGKSRVCSSFRTHLPAKTPKCDSSIWSVLKTCIGKDLSKITMPVQFNEPLSFLQRISEHMEYSELLNFETDDPVERIQKVAAFAVSALASNWQRCGKPFNPVFGETYELQRDGYRFVSEQVSHHPPISAWNAESDTFVFHGWIYPKLKLWGKSVEVHPKGNMRLFLKKYNESYQWQHIYCTVHNVVIGKLWIEHHGNMEIQCSESGLKLSLHFKPAGWFHNELHRFEGFITDAKKTKLRYVYGKWTQAMKSTDIESYDEHNATKKSPAVSPSPGRKMFQKLNSLSIGKSFSTSLDPSPSEPTDLSPENQDDSIPKADTELIDIPNSVTLWEVSARPEHAADYNHFTHFAMGLNQVLPDMKSLCPTDSRFRPDIRKLEEGDLDGAAEEKNKLEEKQRKLLKAKSDLKPQWFDKNGEDWSFNGKYWTEGSKSHVITLF
ncbi:Oxysterol-binding protein-related protein 1, partial [Orchesella cincta]